MFKRVAFTTLLAAGLFAMPGAKITDDPVPCDDQCGPLRGELAIQATVADMRTDDPVPCDDQCGPLRGEVAIQATVADMRTDDPVPCDDQCGPLRGEVAIAGAKRA